MPSWKITVPIFLVLLFLFRYYDFFILYQPIQPFSTLDPTLFSFTLYNYLLNAILYIFKFLLINLRPARIIQSTSVKIIFR